MESALQHALLEKAGDVAALIGSIGDDYERAWAQELFEQEMNVRLYVISQQGEAAS